MKEIYFNVSKYLTHLLNDFLYFIEEKKLFPERFSVPFYAVTCISYGSKYMNNRKKTKQATVC